MKRNLYSAISGLLALGGACLLLTISANAAPPGEPMDSNSPPGTNGAANRWGGDSDDDSGGHRHWRRDVDFVVGSAYTAVSEPTSWYLRRTYAVVKNWRNIVRGHIFVDYREVAGDEVFESTYVIKADCLEVDEEERIAWIGGEVVYVTTNYGIPTLGDRVVEYADDNDGGNPLHSDVQAMSYWGPADFYPSESDCRNRLPPLDWSYAESDRGKIVVR